MRELRYNTAVIVSVGPFRDKTDGVTIKGSLTISNERITLIADTDDGNAPTIILDNIAGATSGTNNDLNYIANNDAGMMQLEFTATNTQRYGRVFLTIDDPNNHVSVFHEFEIVSQEYYDAKYGTGNLPANTKALSGDAGAADNLEAACDGSGYNLGGGQIVAASVTSKSEYTLTSAYDAAKTAASQSSVNTVDSILDNIHDTDLPAVKTETAAIKAKTDNLPASPANEATLTTLHGHIDDILGDTAEIQAELADGGRTDLLIDGIKTVVDANGVKLVAVQGKTDMFPAIWYAP